MKHLLLTAAAVLLCLILAACSPGRKAVPEPTGPAVSRSTATPEDEGARSPSPEAEPPAEETEPPEQPAPAGALAIPDGKTCLDDGSGGPICPGVGLQELGGYTYYVYEDGTVAVSETVSVDGVDYTFDDRGRWLSPLREAVEGSATAEKTEQIVLAVDRTLSFWEKAEDGSWRLRMETACGCGKNGLVFADERIMGSGTTPIGAFPLTLAFGTGENPGTAMTYRRITADSYWSEVEDETFNTWVESETPVPGEHLIDYYQYKYAVNIGFNLEDVVYSRGCAIFLHVKSTDHWYTAGCVSLTEEDMLALLLMLRDGAYMIIVPDMETLAEY